MRGKKGMSPLIATILLMAFAVALGAVIMNWSTSLPEGGPDCAAIKLSIKQFCRANGELVINIRNVGQTEIAAISLSVSDPPIEIPQMGIKDSHLGEGQTLDTRIPFGFSEQVSVGILPSLGDHGEAVSCQEPINTFDDLPPC